MTKIMYAGTGLALVVFLISCAPQSNGQPKPYTQATTASELVRSIENPVQEKLKMPSGHLANLDEVLEKLIGSWYSAQENYSEESLAWMQENGISDYYDTFNWGTNKAWIDFGDYRVKAGKPEKTGVGIISWHTGFKHLRFRESGARGGLVDGMIEIKDENTFIRHYEFFTPKGEVKYRSDSWTFDPANLNCFIWQTTTYKDDKPTTHSGRKYCKK